VSTTRNPPVLIPAIPAHERLADTVPIADLVTAPRNVPPARVMGKMMELSRGHLKKLQ
jgi:hypothetical protein